MTHSIRWATLTHMLSTRHAAIGTWIKGRRAYSPELPELHSLRACRPRAPSGWIVSSGSKGASGRKLRPMHTAVSEWKGLGAWRDAPVEERRVWGKNGPAIEWSEVPQEAIERSEKAVEDLVGSPELAKWGSLVLTTADPMEKAWLTHQAFRLWTSGRLEVGTAVAPDVPGRPLKPELVPPRQVPLPKDSNLSPSAHMLHNLAHIELNAIDLAWDTIVRFSHASHELGRDFFGDFLHVADDESRHFRWCSQRLIELGFRYGDMPAHNLLWKDCMKTSGSVKSRLAVIPMMQEARGLDAGPRLVKRLLGLDDHRSAGLVRRIGQEEVAHVGVGVHHFLRVCEKLGITPGDEFRELMVECNIELHGPFNHKARALAGLQRDWYEKTNSSEIGTLAPFAKNTSACLAGYKECQELQAEMSSSEKSSKPQNSKGEDRPKTVDQTPLAEVEGQRILETNTSEISSSSLPEVFDRLVVLVAMEKENAGSSP